MDIATCGPNLVWIMVIADSSAHCDDLHYIAESLALSH